MPATPAAPTEDFVDEPTARRLANGLEVVLQRDMRLPLVAVQISYARGSAYDPDGREGLAHLCEHLAFSGPGTELRHSAGRADRAVEADYISRIERLGGVTHATTFLDRVCFEQTLSAEHLEEGLTVERERMAEPADKALHRLERQRQVLLQEYRERISGKPYGTAMVHLHGLLFPGGHPYSKLPSGTPEGLRRISERDVEHQLHATYRPESAILAVVGAFDLDQTAERIETLFGPVRPETPDRPADSLEVPAARPGSLRRLRVEEPVPVARCYLAYLVPSPSREDWMAAQLWARCLAGTSGSPLQKRLLQAGSARRLVVGTPRMQQTAVVIFEAEATGVGERAVAALEQSLLQDLEKATQSDLDPSGLERARSHTLLEAHTRMQELARQADRLATESLFYGRSPLSPEDLYRLSSAFDVDRLRAWAMDLIENGSGALLTLTPERATA